MTEEKLTEREKTEMRVGETANDKDALRREKEKRLLARKCRRAFSALTAGGIGFLFGGTVFPFSLYPLGCALVAALPKNTVPALCGILLRAVLSAQSGDLLLSVICASALLVCRIVLNMIVFGQKNIMKLKRLPDSPVTRLLLCAVFVFGVSFLDAIWMGVSLMRVAYAVLFTLSAVFFALLFAFFFDETYRALPVFEAGLGAVVFCLSLSLMPFSVGGFSFGIAAAMCLVFCVGFLGVPTRSASVGVLCGVACGGIYAPVLALAGLVTGLFSARYAVLGGIVASAVTVGTAFYFGGGEAILSFLPELAISATVSVFLAVSGFLPRRRASGDFLHGENTAAILWSKRRESQRAMRMRGFSGALDSLSCLMQGLSERSRRPEPEKLTEKCRAIWQSYCEKCPNECSCRGLYELESEKISSKLASRLMSSGRIDRERLYEITRVRCPHLETVAEEISALSAQMLEEAIREDKAHVFALDYEMMSRMFADAAAESDMRVAVDRVLSDRLRRAFFRAGLRAENVLVCGDRKRTVIVTGESIARTDLRPSDIRAICEGVCEMRFDKPIFMLESGKSAFVLETLPLYRVESVVKQLSKKGEFVCGDSVSRAMSHEDYYYCCLCDGMGSGEEAALTSKLCSVFLEKMLVCGNKKSTTLSMLNHLLCSRSTECFATVDVLEIDLVQGIASFLKSGAVPSFIMRKGHLYKVSSGTFPIGILPQVSSEVTDFELCDEDVIVLCSDGIVSDPDASDGEDAVRFLDVMTREWVDDLDLMAEKIITYSADFSRRSDDMTVALLRLSRA